MQAKIDIEIMQLGAEIDNLKKNLLEVCTYNYREIILPAMKDFLWVSLVLVCYLTLINNTTLLIIVFMVVLMQAKLCNVPPKGVSSSEDDKVAKASIENRDPVQEDINVSCNTNMMFFLYSEDISALISFT